MSAATTTTVRTIATIISKSIAAGSLTSKAKARVKIRAIKI
jgi:hypothetical protein